MYRIVLSAIILIIGVALAGQGVWLASLGGSWFYLFMGVGLIISAGLLWDRRPSGLTIYAVTLLITLIWAVWEAGFDWWALSARGSLLVALGVLILLPPMVRAMHEPGQPRAVYGPNSAVLASVIAISFVVAAIAVWQEPYDDVDGAFSAEQMAGLAEPRDMGVPDGEWPAYGRTSLGRRYSPLAQITPQNVDNLEVAWTYRTGAIRDEDDPVETTYEVTPLVINDLMYVCTPFGTVIALDPTTGSEVWKFDPRLQQPPLQTTQHMTCRGVSYFDGEGSPRLTAQAETPAEAPAAEGAAGAETDTATPPEGEAAETGTQQEVAQTGEEQTGEDAAAPADGGETPSPTGGDAAPQEGDTGTDTGAAAPADQGETAETGAQEEAAQTGAQSDEEAATPEEGATPSPTGEDAAAQEGQTGTAETETAEESGQEGTPVPDVTGERAVAAAELIEMSVAEVTLQAAGVPQNVVTEQAPPDAENPRVVREDDGFVNDDPACLRRIFAPTSDGRLISVSAETGEICPGFGGRDGTVNLWANMPNVTPGSVYTTSPPVVTQSVVIVGGAVNDNVSTTSPSGVIRAFDVFTGELVWNFDSKNPDALEPIAAGETYSPNAPNSWSVASYDPELDIVYLPMGNESPDQFGGNRGENTERFSSSILALDASTGEIEWVFQTVHHDIWDYDVPAQPVLVDLNIDGETVPGLVAPTKQGDIFVLNRETGEPIYPVEETPVPQGAVEGDFTVPTQPRSSISFAPEPLRGRDMWGATPIDQAACRIAFRQMRYEGMFTPPSLQGTIVYPGNFGTFNWGSVAVDPARQIMFAMPVYLAFTAKFVPRENELERVVTEEGEPVFNENFGAPYGAKMGPFLSPIGLPCQEPSWGYVAAVDLTTGETVYKRVNGTVRDLSPIPLPFEMGVPGIGGPIVTEGGVAFLSGTLDNYVRAYDLQTGQEIWRDRLPAGGQATPSSYLGSDGEQYVVVVAGGHGSTGTEPGDYIIAYRLGDGGSGE